MRWHVKIKCLATLQALINELHTEAILPTHGCFARLYKCSPKSLFLFLILTAFTSILLLLEGAEKSRKGEENTRRREDSLLRSQARFPPTMTGVRGKHRLLQRDAAAVSPPLWNLIHHKTVHVKVTYPPVKLENYKMSPPSFQQK